MTLHEYMNSATTAYNAYEAMRSLKNKVRVLTVAVGGYRYDIYALDGRFVAAIPKAANASRAVLSLQSDGSFEPYFAIFSAKLQSSAFILSIALEKSKTVTDLVKAIGGATDRCAICGAVLTDPLSASRGIGPECIKKVWAKGLTAEVIQTRIDFVGA